ncbi:autophagy-related protein [Sistotremastrum niveocremeum HHB9708]|uniref:Autophagy protein 5 n=1 Tax=Sistotremastrum niveocremeum HHB9708 TaxID=1314777 RepID=A0A164W3L5_9AGAM|nr:autophagy-related protein [Sistotremastrum niveocremeum HHB9708]
MASSTPTATTLFRRLCWDGTVPIEVKIDSKELPAGSDRTLESFYIRAPRVSYLPLLIQEVKTFLFDLVLDEASAKDMKTDDWWFEAEGGALLKWHWPVGLLYDLHLVAHPAPDFQMKPFTIILHLASPPTDKLLFTPSIETCKQSFMGQLKEADFLRWGNTKRVTSLRKEDQDGLWEGIVEHNFDDFWRIASKIAPSPNPLAPPLTPNPSSPTLPAPSSRPASTQPPSGSDRDNAYSVRSVPVRIYLPDGPVIQDLVPPFLEDGLPHSLSLFLSAQLPLLFKPSPTSSLSPVDPNAPKSNLAFALIQGVIAPLDCEMAWLGACMSGADGWVNVCIGLEK